MDARPIAPKEMMYFVLKQAHAGEGHGGRDKTAKAVKKTHSFVRKGLICLFLESCPTCQARIEAVKKEKMITAQAASNFMTESLDHNHGASSAGPQAVSYPSIHHHRYSLPSIFRELDHPQPSNFLNIQNLQMPIALAQVPAAPPSSFSIPSQGSSMSSCHYPAPPSSSLSSQSYLITPHTAASFGDFQSQQLSRHSLYPEATPLEQNQATSQAHNLPINTSHIQEPIEFFDPFTMTNIAFDPPFQMPATLPDNFGPEPALAPVPDVKVFEDFLANSLQSPISPPAPLAFNDPQHLQQLLFPQNYNNFAPPTTRRSCY